jgi:3-oxoacyl-[acyl-carrier-protein] synthase II
MVGSGIGGIETIYNCSIELKEKGPKRVSPFFITASLINLASGHISIKYGFRGPNHSVVTACSTGSHAIADAARLIKGGETEIMIAGGAEAAVNPIGMVGFIQAKALTSKFNEEPAKGSRPWDANRSGFVMGEGSGILVLEEYEHAKKRGATIYGEIKGYGLSGDAYHITAPHQEGLGAKLAMTRALKSAEINAEEIGYINAHGTSTPAGDLAEVKAVKSLFNSHAYKLAMSSTKSSTGHLLGAAGAVEAIFSILALKEGILPPTINLDEPGEDCDLNFVPHKPQESSIKYAMSNSFGFGGTNSSLILGKV